MNGRAPLRALARRAALFTGDDVLASVTSALARGEPVVASCDGAWRLLRARDCAGHAPTRRLIEIGGSRPPVLSLDASVREVAAALEGPDGAVLIADGGELVGVVEAADVARAVGGEAERRAPSADFSRAGIVRWRASGNADGLGELELEVEGDWGGATGGSAATWADAIDPVDHAALAAHHRALFATGRSDALLRLRRGGAQPWIEDRARIDASGLAEGLAWRAGGGTERGAPDGARVAAVVADRLDALLAPLTPALTTLGALDPGGSTLESVRRAAEAIDALSRDLALLGSRRPPSETSVEIDLLVSSRAAVAAHAIHVRLGAPRVLAHADPEQLAEAAAALIALAGERGGAGALLFTRSGSGASVELGLRIPRALSEDERGALLDSGSGPEPRSELSLVRSIAARNAWPLGTRAGAHGATEIALSLPLAARTTEPARRAPDAPSRGTALVVRDDPRARAALRHALSASGWSVIESADGIDAIELVRRAQSPIHLVVAELLLPGPSGEDVARAVLRRFAGAAVVITTGHRPTGEVLERVPRAVVLSRPYDDDALAAAVERACALPAERRRRHASRPDGSGRKRR